MKDIDWAEFDRLYYRDGKSVVSVAEHFGMVYRTLKKRMENANKFIRPTARGIKITPKKYTELMETMTQTQIAKNLGVSDKTCARFEKEHKLRVRGHRIINFKIDKAKFIKEYKTTKVKVIAEKIGCHPSTIYAWMERNNISFKQRYLIKNDEFYKLLQKYRFKRITFQEYLGLHGVKSAHTIYEYMSYAVKILDYFKNTFNINIDTFSKVDKGMIDKFMIDIKNKYPVGQNPTHYSRVLKHLLDYFEKNISILIPDIPKCEERVCLTIKEMQRLLHFVKMKKEKRDNPIRDYAIILLLYKTLIRREECIQLNLDSIDFNNKILKVRYGKNNRSGDLILDDACIAALRDYIDNYRPHNKIKEGYVLIKDKKYYHINALFLNTGYTRLGKEGISEIVKKHTRRAGINKKITPHIFRHTGITHLVKAGVPFHIVQKQSGHKSLDTLIKHYLHLDTKDVRSAITNALNLS